MASQAVAVVPDMYTRVIGMSAPQEISQLENKVSVRARIRQFVVFSSTNVLSFVLLCLYMML